MCGRICLCVIDKLLGQLSEIVVDAHRIGTEEEKVADLAIAVAYHETGLTDAVRILEPNLLGHLDDDICEESGNVPLVALVDVLQPEVETVAPQVGYHGRLAALPQERIVGVSRNRWLWWWWWS